MNSDSLDTGCTPADYVFLATLGQNDIQIVVRAEGHRPRRYQLNKACVRAFHQACLDKSFDWTVAPFDETSKIEEVKRISLDYDPAKLQLQSQLSEGSESDYVDLKCSSGVELCAPLLAEAWRQIQTMNLGRARRVVLFQTRREDVNERGEPREIGEPIGTVELVRKELVRACGLES
jgi:hypothetical protein